MWWTDWFFFALLAALANGLQGFLFKSSVVHRQDIYQLTFFGATVSYVIAGGFLLFNSSGVGGWKELLLFGLAGGVGFMTVMLTRLAALRHLSAATVFTLFRSNTVIILALTLVLPEVFGEYLRGTQLFGVLMILSAAGLLGSVSLRERVDVDSPNRWFGLLLMLVCVLVSALLYTMQKIAVDTSLFRLNVHAFIFVINLVVALLSLLLIQWKGHMTDVAGSMRSGALLGIYGYLSFVFFLTAMKSGPISLIVSINSASFIIPVLLSTYFFRERLSLGVIFAIILTFGGVILVRLPG